MAAQSSCGRACQIISLLSLHPLMAPISLGVKARAFCGSQSLCHLTSTPTFISTVLQACICTLLCSTHLGLPETLKTCQVPVRGTSPSCVFHLEHLSSYICKAHSLLHLLQVSQQGCLIGEVSPDYPVYIRCPCPHTACLPCSRLAVGSSGPEMICQICLLPFWGGESRKLIEREKEGRKERKGERKRGRKKEKEENSS